MFHLCIWRSCRGCDISELAGSRVLLLREQVRDLRVQKFLRELIVGVAAPSDLARFCRIDYSVEGGDMSKCARTSKQFSRICDCLSLSLMFYILHAYYICAHLLHVWYCLCSIDIHAWDCLISWMLLFLVIFTCLILCMCSHSYWTKRAIEVPQLLIKRNLVEKFWSSSSGIWLHS